MVITEFELETFSREASGRFEVALRPLRQVASLATGKVDVERQLDQAKCRAQAYLQASRIRREIG
jgi:hypothetical protein